jgi:retinoid hydroxylase
MSIFPKSVASMAAAAMSSQPLLLCARFSLVLIAAFALAKNARRLLWPHSSPDASVKAPLPPGSLGCPLVGTPFFWGSTDYGAGSFYRTQARKIASSMTSSLSLEAIPRAFRYYFFGKPFVAVSGRATLQRLLSLEFEPDGIRTAMRRTGPNLVGATSLITESDRKQHSFLRRLVGQALTPAAVAASVPVLQSAVQETVSSILKQGEGGAAVRMDRVCTDFTLDVAWKQILGLNLAPEEVPTFFQAVDDWINGLASIQSVLNFRIKSTKSWKAKEYLQGKVVEKIEDLERNGPDGTSTVSGMVFAADDEGKDKEIDGAAVGGAINRKLTREQVVDNAMLLILAGSETSASTLTNAMAFLGLHRPAWEKLVDEQRRMQAKHGNELTKDALEKECPYLDAVIRETMRIRPLSGGIPRIAKETIVVQGQQIPKGWFVDWSAALSHELDPKTFKEDGSHMDVMKGFQPERWLSEETEPVDYVPMGAGPRYCLGSNLAYVEMKVFLAVLARSLDFELVRVANESTEGLVWKRMSIIPKVENGVPVRVRPMQAISTPKVRQEVAA